MPAPLEQLTEVQPTEEQGWIYNVKRLQENVRRSLASCINAIQALQNDPRLAGSNVLGVNITISGTLTAVAGVFSGALSAASAAITGALTAGTVDSPAVGSVTPGTGKFTTLEATTSAKSTYLDLTTVAPGTPVKDRLYSNLIPRAWVNFKDVAGTITVNASVNCTVGFRTGTSAGDYTLTLTTACADAFSAPVGIAVHPGSGNIYVQGNSSNVLHSTTQYNFQTQSLAGASVRPLECTLIVMGN